MEGFQWICITKLMVMVILTDGADVLNKIFVVISFTSTTRSVLMVDVGHGNHRPPLEDFNHVEDFAVADCSKYQSILNYCLMNYTRSSIIKNSYRGVWKFEGGCCF